MQSPCQKLCGSFVKKVRAARKRQKRLEKGCFFGLLTSKSWYNSGTREKMCPVTGSSAAYLIITGLCHAWGVCSNYAKA